MRREEGGVVEIIFGLQAQPHEALKAEFYHQMKILLPALNVYRPVLLHWPKMETHQCGLRAGSAPCKLSR